MLQHFMRQLYRIPNSYQFSSGFLAIGDSGELTGHGADTSKSTAVAHDGSIAFDLALDG